MVWPLSTETFTNATFPASARTIRTGCKVFHRDPSAVPGPIRSARRCFLLRRPTSISCPVTTGPIIFPPPWLSTIKPWKSIKSSRFVSVREAVSWPTALDRMLAIRLDAGHHPIFTFISERNSPMGEKPWQEALPRYLDHTVLRPEATKADVLRLCAEAKEQGFVVIFV